MVKRWLSLAIASATVVACSPRAGSADNSVATASFDDGGRQSGGTRAAESKAVEGERTAAAPAVPGIAAAGEAGTDRMPFLATFTAAPVPVPNILRSGTIGIAGRCVVVNLADGAGPFTAVFPAGATLRMSGGKPASVSFEGGSLPIGIPTRIPGGRVGGGGQLARSLDPSCPRDLFGIGG